MPTFTSIALDRLLEPGATRSMASDPKSVPRPKGEKYKLNRGKSVTAMPSIERQVSERKYHWAQITPALYTTPETTPLPDSPSSFPPSPYIINHKRRGPRLLKSHSVSSVSTEQPMLDHVNVNGGAMDVINNVSCVPTDASVSATPIISPTDEGHMNDIVEDNTKAFDSTCLGHDCGFHGLKSGVSEVSNGMISMDANNFHAKHVANGEASNQVAALNGVSKSPSLSPVRDGSDRFVDPQESLSFSSTCEVEDDICMDSSVKLPTPGAEFFDAWEELSSEGGGQLHNRDYESELREMKLSLLLEAEKRKQTEDAFNNLQMAWEKIRKELSQVGIILPLCLSHAVGEEHSSCHMEDISQQVLVARFVSQSIGMGLAKAEAQVELEAQLEAKNFEIARLCDRLNYYETVNREMSQRNQESIELARRMRQESKRKRRWVWASITAAVTIGTVAAAWAYIPASRGSRSSSANHLETHGNNPAQN